jgi:hypothetical protein
MGCSIDGEMKKNICDDVQSCKSETSYLKPELRSPFSAQRNSILCQQNYDTKVFFSILQKI